MSILKMKIIPGIILYFAVLCLPPHLYAQVVLKDAFPNLAFSGPVGLYNPGDGSDRLFVLSQAGRIYAFPDDPSVTLAKIFLDIHDSIASGGELGLLGLAFHPNYSANGYFYVYYTKNNSSVNFPYVSVVSMFSVSATNPDSAVRTSEVVLMRINQPFGNHKGGQLAFGPDGYLYIGLGDGGSGGDPQGNAQNTSSWLGKILRINVDSTAGSENYAIPAGNPFYSDTSSTVKKEIFAYGLRNPWRFSFDLAGGGALWVGDVGQGSWEEIDTVHNGRNYGWNIMEGSHCYNPPSGCNTSGLVTPIWEYDHAGGRCSITGGFVYRGTALPELFGKYIYGDYCAGTIWAFDPGVPGPSANTVLINTGRTISSFGTDKYKELYFCSYGNGRIYKLVRQVPAAPVPVSPTNGQTDVITSPTLRWRSSPAAAVYHLQLTLDSAFAAVILNDSAVADTFREVGPLDYMTRYYWRVSANNNSGSSPYSSRSDFSTIQMPGPPAAPVLIHPFSGAVNQPTLINLIWHKSIGAETYNFQISTDSAFTIPSVDDSLIADTSAQAGPLMDNAPYYWRVRPRNASGYGPYSVISAFQTGPSSVFYHANRSWNMVSVPLTVSSGLKDSLFPTSVSKAFEYLPQGGYAPRDTLIPGKGYWLKFIDSQIVAVAGSARSADTIQIIAGWNMIGSISQPVQVDSIVQIPPGIIASSFFGYDLSYAVANVIEPARAYWVKANIPGKLILRSAGLSDER